MQAHTQGVRLKLTDWIHQVGSREQCMWKERQSTTVIIETAALHAGTRTRSRVKTYDLDSSSGIQGAMDVEGRVEHHSDHRNSYTP